MGELLALRWRAVASTDRGPGHRDRRPRPRVCPGWMLGDRRRSRRGATGSGAPFGHQGQRDAPSTASLARRTQACPAGAGTSSAPGSAGTGLTGRGGPRGSAAHSSVLEERSSSASATTWSWPTTCARATEELVLRFNAAGAMASRTGIHAEGTTDAATAGGIDLETFSFDVAVPYTHEPWRGRMRTSNGVGATLAERSVSLRRPKMTVGPRLGAPQVTAARPCERARPRDLGRGRPWPPRSAPTSPRSPGCNSTCNLLPSRSPERPTLNSPAMRVSTTARAAGSFDSPVRLAPGPGRRRSRPGLPGWSWRSDAFHP